MNQITPEHDAALFARELAKVGEAITPLREAVIGYRTQLVAAGFDEFAASNAAVEYHGLLIAAIRRQIEKT